MPKKSKEGPFKVLPTPSYAETPKKAFELSPYAPYFPLSPVSYDYFKESLWVFPTFERATAI